MSKEADLHMHSEYSPDGELKIDAILNACKDKGLTIISITDHNLVKGIPEALSMAPEKNITVIPGVEIDCVYKGIDLHVLGYRIKWESKDFNRLEEQVSHKLMDSFSAMIKNLHSLGIAIEADDVLTKAEGRIPSAELIAEVLLGNDKYREIEKMAPYRQGGERSDMPYINFYLDFFAQGRPAYVKIDFMDYADAISLIKNNGGIPVVAHPGNNLKGREEIIVDLLRHGAEGVETFSNYHSDAQIRFFAGVALKHKVLMTCGSDFHGKNKPLIRVGEYRMLEQYDGYVTESVEELLC
jgi:hypothetical protein